MTVVTKSGHYILGTTSYGDSRCTSCEHNRQCFNSSNICIKDIEDEEKLFNDVQFLKNKVDELAREVNMLKTTVASGITYTYGIR